MIPRGQYFRVLFSVSFFKFAFSGWLSRVIRVPVLRYALGFELLIIRHTHTSCEFLHFSCLSSLSWLSCCFLIWLIFLLVFQMFLVLSMLLVLLLTRAFTSLRVDS